MPSFSYIGEMAQRQAINAVEEPRTKVPGTTLEVFCIMYRTSISPLRPGRLGYLRD